MASDYDEVRPEVKESQESSLQALRTENTPDARSVVRELDEADTADGVDLPGDFIAEELIVEVVPQKKDEFVCSSCFLVHHRSQWPRRKTDTSTALNARDEAVTVLGAPDHNHGISRGLGLPPQQLDQSVQ